MTEEIVMKANPGGVIDPSGVYGRDALIAELWQRLDQHAPPDFSPVVQVVVHRSTS